MVTHVHCAAEAPALNDLGLEASQALCVCVTIIHVQDGGEAQASAPGDTNLSGAPGGHTYTVYFQYSTLWLVEVKAVTSFADGHKGASFPEVRNPAHQGRLQTIFLA